MEPRRWIGIAVAVSILAVLAWFVDCGWRRAQAEDKAAQSAVAAEKAGLAADRKTQDDYADQLKKRLRDERDLNKVLQQLDSELSDMKRRTTGLEGIPGELKKLNEASERHRQVERDFLRRYELLMKAVMARRGAT